MANENVRKPGTGTIKWRGNHLWVRVSLPDHTRPWLRLCRTVCDCHEMSEARRGDRAEKVSEARRAEVRAELAAATDGKSTVTVQEFGKDWTDGKLSERYPDHVKLKRTSKQDAGRLVLYVYPHVGCVRVADFTVDHAQLVMAKLPKELKPATRRHIAQLMHRLLAMAVWPARLRKDNPLPKGFMPKVKRKKSDQWMYPKEEAHLAGCEGVDLGERVLFAFLAREGCREGEALAFEWSDLDLRNGVVDLRENKTDDPRAWVLGKDVTRALERWWVLLGRPASGRVFVHEDGRRISESHLAERLREAMKLAGVTRPSLHEKTKAREPFRVHDLRGTFITLALADGKTETWVADRTGHQSSTMINHYRQAARRAGELGLGWFAPMDQAIPELAALANVRALKA